MKTYTRKEIVHQSILEIRDLIKRHKNNNASYPLERIFEIDDLLYRLGVLNCDKSILFYKIVTKMF